MNYPTGLLFDPTAARPARTEIRSLIPTPRLTGAREWAHGPIVDQAALHCRAGHPICDREHPYCVAAAWWQIISSPPFSVADPFDIVDLYHDAQRRDPFAGEDYAGTTLLAAARALHARGLIAGVRRLPTIDAMIGAVLTDGPIIAGTRWFQGMLSPRDGMLTIDGPDIGPHSYVVYSVDTQTETFGVVLSWGDAFGLAGTARIRFNVYEQLFAMAGEAWIATKGAASG